MQVTCKTIALHGVVARPVDVQCQLSRGLHGMTIVGLPDKAVKEARERVCAAFYSNAIALPPMKITFNLSPADMPKFGNHYDLPMAIALMVNLELLPREEIDRHLSLGALALDGRLEPISGVLASALEASAQGFGLICPSQNAAEAQMVPDIELIAPETIAQMIAHFKGNPIVVKPQKFEKTASFGVDMAMIKGMEVPRRALEIAASGRHHLFMVGPPGTGKSLLASSLPTIMPPMTAKECLESTLVHSAAALVQREGMVHNRPYYNPHHTASAVAIVGGGPGAGPGAISLAHCGVLFLDELPEFKRDVLESLRQPLENGDILISRANAHYHYPAKFLLVAAANPCRCGMLLDVGKACPQAPICGHRYMERISGPLFDRFGLRIIVPAMDIKDLQDAKAGESSQSVQARVIAARERQYARNGEMVCNEDLDSIALDHEVEKGEVGVRDLLQKAARRFGLSSRGYYRMIKIARTIADLEATAQISCDHIAETALYRTLESTGANYQVNKLVTSGI